MKTLVVAGNPKPASRTLDAGLRLARLLAGRISGPAGEAGGGAGPNGPGVVDVITLGPALLGWGDGTVKAAVGRVAAADLVVVASPTFKATYTGVLKLFLDQFATGDGLEGVTAVPLMLGAGPAHALAPELLLKPVLVELGATCPAPGLYQIDRSYAEDGTAEAYARRWAPSIAATAGRLAGDR